MAGIAPQAERFQLQGVRQVTIALGPGHPALAVERGGDKIAIAQLLVPGQVRRQQPAGLLVITPAARQFGHEQIH